MLIMSVLRLVLILRTYVRTVLLSDVSTILYTRNTYVLLAVELLCALYLVYYVFVDTLKSQ